MFGGGPSWKPLEPSVRQQRIDHIASLCAKRSIQWHQEDLELDDMYGEPTGEGFRITTRPIVSEIEYLVALHEVGHEVLGLASFNTEGERLFANEASVWEWTIENAIATPSEDAVETMVALVGSHDRGGNPEAAIKRIREVGDARRARD